jgi:predicted Ser/Thr protein kinase
MEEEEQRRRQAEGGEKHVWELSSKDIILGRTLGKGAFGVVYAGKLHGKEVAVKKLLAAEIDQEALAAFKHEVDIMNKLRFVVLCPHTHTHHRTRTRTTAHG